MPAYGGAVYGKGSSVKMSGCTFTGNAVDVENNNSVYAAGGGVYISSDSSGSMKDCTVTGNQSSYSYRAGAGVYVATSQNKFVLSGKMIIEGNSCYYLDDKTQSGINVNDNLHLFGDKVNISIKTSDISKDSSIFVNTVPGASENKDARALISDKDNKSSLTSEELKKCIKSDIGGYTVESISDSGLYLVSESIYDELWYGNKRVTAYDEKGNLVVGYGSYKSFFSDKDLVNDTGFTRLVDAVGSIKTDKTIHMLTSYETSVSETVTIPEKKVINVVRESTFTNESMFSILGGEFTINANNPDCSITFDGQNFETNVQYGGVFYTNGNSFNLNGAERTVDGKKVKTIVIKNTSTSFSYQFSPARGSISLSSGTNTLTHCCITGNQISSNYTGQGAGICILGGTNTIKNCDITENKIYSKDHYSGYPAGGGVCINRGTNTFMDCNITGNSVSCGFHSYYNYGGGVYIEDGTNTLLGTMNITGNTYESTAGKSANNLHFESENPVALSDTNGNTLGTSSNIGVSVWKKVSEGSPVKFASSATEAMKACFTPDVSDYVVRFASNENALYLAVPTYSELWYKADENDANTKKFFEGSDVNNLTATDITKFSKAVQSMSASGKIHMLTTYESAADETTTVPASKNITVLRDGTFNNASMFSITKGTFEINATDASSSITFDGNKIETKVNEGGAFNANGGSINFKGADKSGGGKTITIQNNIISSSSASGGGVNIYNSGANTLENCSITYNKAESSSSLSAYGGGVCISGRGTNTLTNCSITGNTISSSSPGAFGGGVYIDNGTNTLTNCSITENKAEPSFNARGGGVCIYGGTNTLSNCSITGNTISSSSSAYGGGVCIYENTTLLGTTNITGNTVKNGSDSSDSNLYLASSSYTAALSDSSGNKLSAGSQIGVTTDSDPTSGTDQKFATNATEDEMMNYFTSDKGYVIYKQGTDIYLTRAPSDLYQSDNKFYLDAEKTKLTNIKTMAEAVKIATNIHMLSAYTASSDETVEVPSGKNVTVSRHSTFANDAMIRVNGGNLTVKATDTTSSITFDGQNVETTVTDAYGGIIHVAGTEGTSLALTGADNNGTKTINFVNSFVKGPSAGGAIRNNGTATLTNCNISNNKASPTDGGSIAGGVSNFGTLTMESCLVNGNSTTGNMSGGIYAGSNAIKSTIKNCQVTNNSSKLYGGGIFLSSGGGDNSGSPISIIEDCTVTGNTAGDSTATPAVNGYGAGIYIGAGANGTSTISRTTISENNAAGGGGLYISDGTNTITSCTITKNQKSSWGGGVRIDGGTNKFEGCSVINNEASSRGGGFYLTKAGSTTLTRCTISGNIAPAQGGAGIFFTKNADGTAGTLALSGAMSITGNNSKDSTDENNLWIGDGLTIDVSGLATEGSAIGILTENDPTSGNDLQFATNATEEMKACFTHDPDTSEVVYKDGGLYLRYIQSLYYSTKSGSGLFYNDEACTNATSYTKLSEAVGSITSKGNIYMMSQYASSADEETNVTAGKSIKVIRHKSFKDASMFKITGGTFTVKAEDATSLITFDGKKIETTVDEGGAFYVKGGNINLSGADKSGGGKTIAVENNVSSSSASVMGGGVFLSGGTNTLTNCSITGNTASSSRSAYGGGISSNYGTHTLTNCSITGNTASSTSSSYDAYGGGAFLSGSGTKTLTNCSITENKAESSKYAGGGGVYINYGTNPLINCSITGNTVSASSTTKDTYAYGGGVYIGANTPLLGTMNITGNTAKVGSDSSDSNLYFKNGYKVALSDSSGGTLSADSQIGVTTEATPTDGTDVQFATSATEEMKACFKSDIMGRAVIYKDSGLYITLGYDALYYKDGKFYGDEACTYDTGLTKLSEAVQKAVSGSTIHMMSQYASSADETVDVPAGKNITVSRYKDFKNAPMFKITGGTFKVNATDATSSITFDGKKIETSVERGGAFCVSGSSTKFILNGADKYGGGKTIAIENNVIYSSGSTQGSGVYIWSGTNTLENCSIAGNIVSSSSAACGGGVLINGGANTLTNCSITGNTASSSASSAYGGGVYVGGGTNTLENCSITGNTASSSASYSYYYAEGGGVFIDYETTNTLLGTMNITGNTAKVRSTSSDGNLYFSNGETVALSDSSGDTLSADSHIGVTTQASAPAKFATGVTDDIAAVRFCFDDDKKANEVYRIGTELYLGKDSSVTYEKYDNLYYYRTTTGDNNDGLFYTDSSHKNSAGIKLLSEAVGHLNKGGNIYFLTSYTTLTTGERVVAPPDMGEIHIIRYSSSGTTFDGESMININGLFEVTCPHTNSTIIFDGNNVSTKNTGAGILWLWQTGSARIIGASPSCKNIKFVNSIITTGGGAAIRLGGGDNVIKNCIIEGNKRTSTDSEGSGAVLLLENDSHANSTSMENCDLINNTSAGNAGALYVASGTHSFTNCNITNNQGFGGGSYINGGTNSFTGCKISNNTSVKVGSIEPYGGGLYINKGTNYFLNCEINGNKAHNGGGLISKSATNTFEKCTVSGNVIDDYGNGLCLDGSSNTIIDCTITDNKGASHGAGIWVGGGTVNIYGNTVVKNNVLNDGTTENNVEVGSGKKVSLNDSAGKVLGTSSNIGITTYTAPTSSAPVQFATGASEEMKACFTADNSDYYVDYKGSDNGLYLCVRTTYNDLYYKNNNFYSDSACSNSTGITKMSEAVASMTSSGKIHMLSQYASSADETVTVPAGRNVTVLRESSFTNASMFKITGGTFKVNAPKTNSSITFDGKSLTATANFNGGAFDVGGDSGKLELNGASDSTRNIILQNNRANKGVVWDSITNHGGAIYVGSQGGGVTCNNCVMKGNASSMRGGAVCVVTGTNSFKNCTMDSNSKPYYGGAFASFGIDGMAKVVNTLENCSFTNNASIDYGGNLLLDDGTNTFTNCTISGGSTRQKGSGVYCTGATATFEGCSIKNNTGSSYGGGINFLRINTSNIKVSNTEISGNTASSNGGGIYVEIYNNETKGKLTLTGATKITGNKVSSSANNVYIVKDQLIDVTGLATEQGAIGVKTAATPTSSTPVQFATGATEAMKACFTHDPGTSEVVYKDGGLYLAVPTYGELWYKADGNDANTKKFFEGSDVNNLTATGITKFSKAVQHLSASGKIHMLTTYESAENETTTMPAGKNITVLREGTFKDASMFKITGGTFTVNATDASSSITFDGQKIKLTSSYNGGAFYVDGGNIKLNGTEKTVENQKEKTIIIKDNIISASSDYTSAYGGGFYIKGGINTLTNCSITGNKVSTSSDYTSAYGGGIFIRDGSNTLTNCSITSNIVSDTSSYDSNAVGGGVYIDSSGTNTLTNCSITGNKVSSTSSSSYSVYPTCQGGGVYIGGSGTSALTSCSIVDNTASVGVGVCILDGTNTLESCSITGNTASSSDAYGGGIFSGGGTNTLIGTMNITENTASDSSNNNLYLDNGCTVALSSGSKSLSTDSKIGLTPYDLSSAFVQFATNATEEMKTCFTEDSGNGGIIYKDGGLYLAPICDDLYYKDSDFYSNSSCTATTGITKLADALLCVKDGGTIHMLSSYAVSSGSETAVTPTDRSIKIVRDSSFSTGIMFNISGGSLTIKAPNTTKTKLTISGENIDIGSQQGGAFTVSGSGSLTLAGASSSNRNLVITKHKANSYAMNLDSGSCLMKNCYFTENTATDGFGGILVTNCKTIFDGCKISGNKSKGSGSKYYFTSAGILVASSGTTTLVGDMEVIDNYDAYNNTQANLMVSMGGSSDNYYSIALSYTDSNGVTHKLTSGERKIGVCSVSILAATRIFATGATSDMVKCFAHDVNSSYKFKISGTDIYMYVG